MGARAILAAVALLVPSMACGPELPVPLGTVDLRLIAQDRSWRASYVLATEGGHGFEVPTGREVHVPLGGDEMCGRPHDARARGWLVIDRPADYQQWVRTHAREAR